MKRKEIEGGLPDFIPDPVLIPGVDAVTKLMLDNMSIRSKQMGEIFRIAKEGYNATIQLEEKLEKLSELLQRIQALGWVIAVLLPALAVIFKLWGK